MTSMVSRALSVSRVVAPAAVSRVAAIAAPCQHSVSGSFMPSMAGTRMHMAVRCFASDGAAAHVADVLKNEMEFEVEDYTPPDVRLLALEAYFANLAVLLRMMHPSAEQSQGAFQGVMGARTPPPPPPSPPPGYTKGCTAEPHVHRGVVLDAAP